MGGLLTTKHKAIIRRLATTYKKDRISLYEASSLSGTSETLRYRRDWIDTHGRWGAVPRYETGMIFSVKVYDGSRYLPKAKQKYEAMVKEAKVLFRRLRK